jgi:hypothetical protein
MAVLKYILDATRGTRRSFASWLADVRHLGAAIGMSEGAAVVFSSGVQKKAPFGC